VEPNKNGNSTCTDMNYTCIRPSVDTNAVNLEVKDTTATNTYLSLKDTDVLDPLKFVVDAKDLDTKSFGSSHRSKS
jgi:hypothetical protein